MLKLQNSKRDYYLCNSAFLLIFLDTNFELFNTQ